MNLNRIAAAIAACSAFLSGTASAGLQPGETPDIEIFLSGATAQDGNVGLLFQDLSLQVQGGEVVGLLGPNGAGKTTSFYMLVGLVRADAGNIYLDDLCITHHPMHRLSLIHI